MHSFKAKFKKSIIKVFFTKKRSFNSKCIRSLVHFYMATHHMEMDNLNIHLFEFVGLESFTKIHKNLTYIKSI